jgi:hypothetical protein
MPSRGSYQLVDDSLQLRIKDVVDAGLHEGRGPVTVGTTPGGLDFPVFVEGAGDHLDLTLYAGWGDVRQRIQLTETPVHFGGTRRWFLCPRCGRRCGVLYCVKEFACRTCHNLRFKSQYESPRERMLRQLLKIRKVIGTGMDIYGPLAPPPRGMSKRRWLKMCQDFLELREKYWRECERPCDWRNAAPKADHWKIGSRVPSRRLV